MSPFCLEISGMTDISPEEMRVLIRQGITDWMDGQFSKFARWTVKGTALGVMSAIFAGFVWAVFRAEMLGTNFLKDLVGTNP